MKRLLLLVCALTIAMPTVFSQKKEVGKVQTVVIDPGHGGNKPGASGRRSQEKDLTLAIALKFGKLIADNYPDVTVIYTRTTDVDVDLAERAHMANRAKADLFISIHANSHKTPGPTGVETFVMGLSQSKSNMEVAKTENADILLEAGYKNNAEYKGFDPNSPESYVMFAMYQNAYLDRSLNLAQYIQNEYMRRIKTQNRGVKQAELFVLYKTTMPAVLTEVGFISNPEQEAYMMSDEGQGNIAVSLFNAFAEYKAASEGGKKPNTPVIDLPGYGKNKPSAAELAKQQRIKDSTFIADSIAAVAEAEARALQQAEEAARQKAQQEAEEARAAAAERASGVSYRVQFLVSETELAEGDKAFRGVTGYRMYKQGNTFRYTMGDEPNTKRAVNIQNELRKKGFKDAFVIAFYHGERITLQEAKELSAQ